MLLTVLHCIDNGTYAVLLPLSVLFRHIRAIALPMASKPKKDNQEVARAAQQASISSATKQSATPEGSRTTSKQVKPPPVCSSKQVERPPEEGDGWKPLKKYPDLPKGYKEADKDAEVDKDAEGADARKVNELMRELIEGTLEQ